MKNWKVYLSSAAHTDRHIVHLLAKVFSLRSYNLLYQNKSKRIPQLFMLNVTLTLSGLLKALKKFPYLKVKRGWNTMRGICLLKKQSSFKIA